MSDTCVRYPLLCCSRLYKPSSVPPKRVVFVIYLGLRSPAASSNLPLDIGRAALHTSIYLVLHPVGCTAGVCRHLRGRLLPCLFTLTRTCVRAVIFCYTLPRPYEHLSVRKHGALWCSDFPPVAVATGDKPCLLFSVCKGTKKYEKTKKMAWERCWSGL